MSAADVVQIESTGVQAERLPGFLSPQESAAQGRGLAPAAAPFALPLPGLDRGATPLCYETMSGMLPVPQTPAPRYAPLPMPPSSGLSLPSVSTLRPVHGLAAGGPAPVTQSAFDGAILEREMQHFKHCGTQAKAAAWAFLLDDRLECRCDAFVCDVASGRLEVGQAASMGLLDKWQRVNRDFYSFLLPLIDRSTPAGSALFGEARRLATQPCGKSGWHLRRMILTGVTATNESEREVDRPAAHAHSWTGPPSAACVPQPRRESAAR